MSVSDANEHMNMLVDLKEKLDKVNNEVLKEIWDSADKDDNGDELVSEEMDTWFAYDDRLSKCLSLLKTAVSLSPGNLSDRSRSEISQLKLPELPLPTFGNREGEDISKFLREFEATIDKYDLSTHVKFTLLTRQLSGDSLKLVNSLDCSNRSYEEAKKLLQKAFADTLSQQYRVIKQLSELKLTYQSDPYDFISNMRIICNQFEALSIDQNIVLQYFIWNGFNDCFKNQLMHITGSNKPSLQQIDEHIFTALERYRNISKKFNVKQGNLEKKVVPNSNCLASAVVNVEKSKVKECSLCLADNKGDIDHPIFKCSVYVTPQSKIEKLKQLNFCTNCTYDSHKTSDCRFKFNRKCKHCNKWHFSYLCKFRKDPKSTANNLKNDSGRLIMPLLWNGKVAHLLGKNQNLSKAILKSNFKKFSKKDNTFQMIDEVFKEQEQLGIIERVTNLEQFLEENPQHSFLPHMPVFKMDRESTKCRNVFLSNLCESDKDKPLTLSHNQTIFAGPCLNKKISTSILQLRFNEKLLCFDIKKAFLMIKLVPSDQSRLLFYWYRNVSKKDYSLIVYKHCRLPFGLPCSPTLLMLALYKILMLDVQGDNIDVKELKTELYNLAYMDNLAYTTNDIDRLKWVYEKLDSIFSPYKFELQQFITNDDSLQKQVDKDKEKTPAKVKLLGLLWDRNSDTLSASKLVLDKDATTKRQILSSIAANFDVFSFYGSLLNRARLFMHSLQCRKEVGWDDRLSGEELREWSNICKQVNGVPEIAVKRFVGRRNDPFQIIAFCDSSKLIYGVVLFIKNLRTKEVSFLLSKNRIIGRQLELKSIPSLEFQSLLLGTETIVDIYKELSGSECVSPINITKLVVFSDSAVALNWLNSRTNRFDKLKKLSIFVMNRLQRIENLCETVPVTFKFCAGMINPADCTTRSLSYKRLIKSNFFTGPDTIHDILEDESLDVTIPNPLTNVLEVSEGHCEIGSVTEPEMGGVLNSTVGNSDWLHLISVYKHVLTFINNVKRKLKNKSGKYDHFEVYSNDEISLNAWQLMIMQDQRQHFPDVFKYFRERNPKIRDMPNIVSQLNLFIEKKSGLLRVKSKFHEWRDGSYVFPILLAKNSKLTEEIIRNFHVKLAHSGIYATLSEARKQFWIPCSFSTVKKVLKTCVHCRRFNGRTIKLNQSPYREFRVSPPTIPYRYIFIDYFGPYWVYWMGKKSKVWILCITCLWSRAINLKVCVDLSVISFLRALQLHCFEFGVPELCLSDQGSQLTSGARTVENFLSDKDTQSYFRENNIKPLSFQQYYKGHSELGSLVESCVKMVKRLIEGSIRNMVLEYLDFDFGVQNIVHIVNRRPIAFKECLRNNDGTEPVPSPITPEILVKGHELNSLNIIPHLHPLPRADDTWVPDISPISHVKDSHRKLRKARESIIEIYNKEFVVQLVNQATDKRSRYQPVNHKLLEVGDIVLIKEPLLKPTNFPMGIVKEIKLNSLGEVTGATVLKGKSREETKRHVSSLIPLLYKREYEAKFNDKAQSPGEDKLSKEDEVKERPKRRAAIIGKDKVKKLLDDNLA
ncbi:uncharacterized protein [Palaemon carinicauda]|uniref:uncharacterized protein n=1 Tax=Palaemon carinicauda TaxID=392227 RepID=UPI0035B65140